jgi:DHA2 family metal-tetracycline-proton antiporter-like MFS transporter
MIRSCYSELETESQNDPAEKIIRILAVTLALGVMSATMYNIALPVIRSEFQLSFSQVSWITSAYLLIFAIGTVVYGKLADIWKLKNLITFGLSIFALGSMIGLFAQEFWMVLLGRMIQAVGAGAIPASAGIITVRYFPADKRGRAIGISMTGGAIGSAAGPAVAAIILGFLHWRFLFCVPLLSLIVLPYYHKFLKDEPKGSAHNDWIGGGLLAGSVALLLLAITYESWTAAASCLFLFILFTWRILSATEPFIRPEQFRNIGYTSGLVFAFVATGVGYSLVFISPQLLTQVHHLPVGLVGFVMIPAAVATAFMGRKGGKIADSRGNPFLFYIASLLYVVCFTLLSSFSGSSPMFISFILILGSVGQAFMSIAISNGVSRTLHKEQAGVGMGLMSMLNFMAGAVSASIYSKLIDHGAVRRWNPANVNPEIYVYGNLYIILAILIVFMIVFYSLLKRKDAW